MAVAWRSRGSGARICQLEWLLLICLLQQLHSSSGVPPTLRSSVDGYKTVCPGEEIHFTCSVQNSNLLTWKSLEYLGRNAVIEFNRDFDRLGDGKSTSLPNRETALLQLASLTHHKLEATLRIVIVSSVANASVECANDVPESKQKILFLAESAPAAPILQLVTDNTKFYYLSLSQSTNNSNRVDIDSYKATVIVGSNFSETYTLSNYTREFMLPSLYQYNHYSENVTLEVVAIDRCGRESPPAMAAIPANNSILSSQVTECSTSDEVVTTTINKSEAELSDHRSDGHRDLYSSIPFLLLPILMYCNCVL